MSLSFKRISCKRQLFILCCINVIFVSFAYLNLLLNESSLKYWQDAWEQHFLSESKSTKRDENHLHSLFIVDTDGCKIPNFEPRDIMIFDHIVDLISTPICSEVTYPIASSSGGEHQQRGPPLVKSNLTAMWVDREYLELYYNESDYHVLKCCYRPFWRVQEDSSKYSTTADSQVVFSNECIPFTNTYETSVNESEFVRVECSQISQTDSEENYNLNETLSQQTDTSTENKLPRSKEIYRDFHAFVPKKREVEERCSKNGRNANEVNILILGLDSMSRLNMLREMPTLHSVLTSPPLNAISLLGHTKVGDNTFPNIMPVLTGLAEEELPHACPWPTTWHKLDPCPFIWKDYAKSGYRTAYGEDASWMSAFQHLKTGFLEAPTDYYIRPYLHESEKEMSHSNILHADFCIGPRMTTASILDYITKFCEKFLEEKYFGFFWTTSLTHDYLTAPHNGDAIFSKTIHNLATRGVLNNTVLFVFSDHGMRWGGIRETYQGVMEEKLPFAYISFPTWFEQLYPTAVANVRANAQKLTSHFDLYETLKDLLHLRDNLGDDLLEQRSKTQASIKQCKLKRIIKTTTTVKPKLTAKEKKAMRNNNLLITFENNVAYVISNGSSCQKMTEVKYETQVDRCSYWRKPRGISLFLPIPTHRTCDDAGIPDHYCSCQTSTELPMDSPLTMKIAIFVVKQINYWLKKYDKCTFLQLMWIKNARINKKSSSENSKIFDYTVTIITSPGKAIFEATVIETYDESSSVSGKSNLTIGGPISRLNLYGNQSYCIDDAKMKLYCFCHF